MTQHLLWFAALALIVVGLVAAVSGAPALGAMLTVAGVGAGIFGDVSGRHGHA